MRSTTSLVSILAATYDADRERGVDRRNAHHRALLESRVVRPSLPARLGAATLRFARRDRHSLTNYPCRLPDGKIGRVAVIQRAGDWTMVCRVA